MHHLSAVNPCAFYVHILQHRVGAVSHYSAGIASCPGITRNGSANNTKIVNACTTQHAKKASIINSGDVDVLYLKEIAVELSGECAVGIPANRSMCRIRKVDIACKHIVACKIRRINII